MKLTVQKNTRIEDSISPPMQKAITLPLLINDEFRGIALYVALSAFAKTIPDTEMRAVASAVVDRIHPPQKTPEMRCLALMEIALRAAFLIDTLPGAHQDVSDELRYAVQELGNT